MINRKAESIAVMCETKMIQARADFEAAASLAKSLDAVVSQEYDQMEIEAYGRYRELSERVLNWRNDFLRAIGELKSYPLTHSKAFEGVNPRRDAKATSYPAALA